MYFGTEARLLKAEGSQEAMVEVKASSGMSGLWEAEAQGVRKFSDWERACRSLSAGRPGEEEEESLGSQFSSFSSALSPTTC